ncbi:MAG: sialidase family protein [Alphaproteobacteria bacterium]|nr:sialidase family protein [Alphaproteobacteria bacterium]
MQQFHVASRKGLFTVTPEGRDWRLGEPAFPGDPVSAVLVDGRDGAVYAALNLGHFGVKLHRSDDGGANWTEIAAPAFDEEKDQPPPDPMSGDWPPKREGPSVELIWALAAGGNDQPGTLWAGTIPGGLFVSRDRGESWALNEVLWNDPSREGWFGGGYDRPGIHSILVDPRASARITVGISSGGVWTTEDNGTAWSVGSGLRNAYMPPDRAFDPIVQDPHRLAQCLAAPDIVWCQHHNGIFRSTDGGGTFAEITAEAPSRFGFAVAAHPEDPDTAWFVPAVKDEFRYPVDRRMVVMRTSDGGASFEVFADGLPQEDCFDLVYRQGLDVDETGDRLVMGSTTGHLWLGEAGGTRWRQLAAHLPPIYQVAWGAAP